MRRITPMLVLAALLIVPATAGAQDDADDAVGLTATVQTGPTFFLDAADERKRGYHVDIYPGYEVADGLSVELNLGFRSVDFQNQNGNDVKFSYIPAVVPGIRHHFNPNGVVQPYFHGHVGLGFAKADTPGGLFDDGESTKETFTFNYGAGLDIFIIDEFGLGVGVTGRHHVVNDEFRNLLEVDVGASVKF